MKTLILLAALVQEADKNKERDMLLKSSFDAMEKAIREGDDKLFKAQWHADGHAKNLVGGSGLTGESVYKQGARKKWFPKPDLAKAESLGEGAAILVPCEIWGWEKEKALDQVLFVLVKVEVKVEEKAKSVYVVLGGGEKGEEVKALADRWLKKEPLDPPKKEEK
jgi:hypothetical protein